MTPTIQSARLDLIPMTPPVIRALLAWDHDSAGQLLDVRWPADCEVHRSALEMRLGQLEDDPALQPWLMRAMVLREEGVAVGNVGFHAAPGPGPCLVTRGPSLRDGIEINPAPPALSLESAACGRVIEETVPERRATGGMAAEVPLSLELGYGVMEAYRRRGFATEACEALMRWAREKHGVERFVASISPENGPSLSLAAKLGFKRIGWHMDEFDGPEDVFERVWGMD